MRQDETSKKHIVESVKDLVTNKDNYQKNIHISIYETMQWVLVLLAIL